MECYLCGILFALGLAVAIFEEDPKHWYYYLLFLLSWALVGIIIGLMYKLNEEKTDKKSLTEDI